MVAFLGLMVTFLGLMVTFPGLMVTINNRSFYHNQELAKLFIVYKLHIKSLG